MRKDKWCVYGAYGGYFTNLKDACKCAKEASMQEEHKDDIVAVWLIEEESWYIGYENGKKIIDGWHV